jgi:hypothetical protein
MPTPRDRAVRRGARRVDDVELAEPDQHQRLVAPREVAHRLVWNALLSFLEASGRSRATGRGLSRLPPPHAGAEEAASNAAPPGRGPSHRPGSRRQSRPCRVLQRGC